MVRHDIETAGLDGIVKHFTVEYSDSAGQTWNRGHVKHLKGRKTQ